MRLVYKLSISVAFALLTITQVIAQESFEIRGLLPWHNFLSGPSAWNEADYEEYLDECQKNNINFIGFHNYTGGGERYATYVEPMIKISYKGILPQAFFDNSLSSRWGYLPLGYERFTTSSKKAIGLPAKAKAFGSDASIYSKTTEEHYESAQGLMKNVMKMAHDRGIQMAMGFEFGVLPPEYFSLNMQGDSFYWPGESNMIPNPTHPIAIDLHYAALDNILETYEGIDWIWMWLNEHSFMSVDVDRALKDPYFAKIYEEYAPYFTDAKTDKERFVGVWSMEYMKITYEYLKKKNVRTKLILGGWGGGNQLPGLLKTLDKQLPKDIVFSCLNPELGIYPQPDFLADIAKNRKVWTVPWLEGDHQLWHFQPRVNKMTEHVKLAEKQKLDGVLAIHWRTEEVRFNLKSFAHFASNPSSDKTVKGLYTEYLTEELGLAAAKRLAPLLTTMDIEQTHSSVSSPEYFGYLPNWGKLDEENISIRQKICEELEKTIKEETNTTFKINQQNFRDMFLFELLLNDVARAMVPAFELKREYLRTGTSLVHSRLEEAQLALLGAPLKKMIDTFAGKTVSRGEMGVLSSLNQRLLREFDELKSFLETELKNDR